MQLPKQERPYSARLRRDPKKASARLSIHERDRHILTHLCRTRVMSAEHLAALVKTTGTTNESIVRRLHKLFHAGFLDRPRYQGHHSVDPLTGQYRGLRSLIYALGPKGAQVAGEDMGNDRVGRLNWLKKNRELGSEYLEHALMVAQLYTALQLAIRKAQGVELIFWQEGLQLKDVYFTDPEGNYVQRSDSQRDLMRHVICPDAYFGLSLPGKQGDTRCALYYFVEVDRSSMPHERFLVKLKDFWRWNRLGLHTRTFDIRNFLVLTVTLSTARRDNLRHLARQADDWQKGSALFRFAAIEHFPLDKPWQLFGPLWFTPVDDRPIDIFS